MTALEIWRILGIRNFIWVCAKQEVATCTEKITCKFGGFTVSRFPSDSFIFMHNTSLYYTRIKFKRPKPQTDLDIPTRPQVKARL